VAGIAGTIELDTRRRLNEGADAVPIGILVAGSIAVATSMLVLANKYQGSAGVVAIATGVWATPVELLAFARAMGAALLVDELAAGEYLVGRRCDRSVDVRRPGTASVMALTARNGRIPPRAAQE
jgi:hypothetical protein